MHFELQDMAYHKFRRNRLDPPSFDRRNSQFIGKKLFSLFGVHLQRRNRLDPQGEFVLPVFKASGVAIYLCSS